MVRSSNCSASPTKFSTALFIIGAVALDSKIDATVLINDWQRRGIRADRVDCDYYDWKKGKPWAINDYQGEYMTQYSWAEMTHGALEEPQE